MPWWSWLIIWVGLAVALLAMFGFLGWRLFRKGIAIFDELDALMTKADALASISETLRPDPPQNAILRGYAEVATEYDRRRDDRAAEKEAHRRERILRGKLLIRSTPSKEN